MTGVGCERLNRLSLNHPKPVIFLGVEMSNCKICKVKLTIENWNLSMRHKRYYICKECLKIKNREYNIKNVVSITKNKKEYNRKNRSSINARIKKVGISNMKSWEGYRQSSIALFVLKPKIGSNRKK